MNIGAIIAVVLIAAFVYGAYKAYKYKTKPGFTTGEGGPNYGGQPSDPNKPKS